MITSITDDLGPALKIIELVPLNVKGNWTEATLRKSGVRRSNGGACRSEVCPMGEVGPQRIKEGAQVRQSDTLRCKTISHSSHHPSSTANLKLNYSAFQDNSFFSFSVSTLLLVINQFIRFELFVHFSKLEYKIENEKVTLVRCRTLSYSTKQQEIQHFNSPSFVSIKKKKEKPRRFSPENN